MGKKTGYLKKRSRDNYIISMVSIALVLFFLGLFSTIALFIRSSSTSLKEAVVIKVFLRDGIKEDRRAELSSMLESAPYINELRYISKEDAGKIMMDASGEDVVEMMGGVNPLLASFDLRLKEAYVHPDNIQVLRESLTAHVEVSEVWSPDLMVKVLNRNFNSIYIVILVTSVIVVLISFYLIFGTIRLLVYARRLSIRSMQLIGATKRFIRRPFVWGGLSQGFLAGLIAVGMLILLLVFVNFQLAWDGLPDLLLRRWEFIAILAGIVLFGAVLGYVGSFIAVNRYLNKNLDEIMKL